jgi:hypothetical protein
MSGPFFRRLILAGMAFSFFAIPALPQVTQPRPADQFVPRLEAVAETRLLMEGLNQSNVRGLETLLKKKPETVEAWAFGRGQALLIAETGNLLLLRPPKNQGRDLWQMRATELRDSATALARTLARQDFEGSRAALVQLANSCNRCHQSFQSAVRVTPLREQVPQP